MRARLPILLLLMCAALARLAVGIRRRRPAWSSATGAEQFERLLWQEIKAKNWNAVEPRLASTYVSQTSGAWRDRSQTMEHFKALEISDFSLGDVEVRPAGADMVVTYKMNLRGTYQGQSLELKDTRMMTVWQQVKGGWVAVAHADSIQ